MEGDSDEAPRAGGGYTVTVLAAAIALALNSAFFWGLQRLVSFEQEAPLQFQPGLRAAWDSVHVAETCAGVDDVIGRRLSADRDYEKVNAAPPFSKSRRLHESAVFDPRYLYRFDVGDGRLMPYYGSADLSLHTPSSAETAVLFFHGALRNAQNYFCSGKRILEMSRYDTTNLLLITPKFHYEEDYHVSQALWWNGSKPIGDWRSGGSSDPSDFGKRMSSFEVVDRFVEHLSNPVYFPKIKSLILMGHSAGGQLVQRYAMATHIVPQTPELRDDPRFKDFKALRTNLSIRYVVANPSSYGYLNNMRWAYDYDHKSWDGFTKPVYKEYKSKLGRAGWQVDSDRRRNWGGEKSGQGWAWGNAGFQSADPLHRFICEDDTFNYWHYGINWRRVKYGNLIPYMQLHPNLSLALEYYSHRNVVYLVGQNDTCMDDALPNGRCLSSCWMRNIRDGTLYNQSCYRNIMDIRCPAMLQGPNRNLRAKLYLRHLEEFYGKSVHKLHEVKDCGHEPEKIFLSSYGQTALFGEDSESIRA